MSAGNRLTRLGLGLRAALAALLAVGAAVLAVDVSDWRYARADLTARHSGTLDDSLLEIVDKLPEPVVLDVFLRPLRPPYYEVFAACEDRLLEFLTILRNARRAQIEIRLHEPTDFESIQGRLQELGTEGTNKVVLSCGGRRDELELFGELCTVDWGTPDPDKARYLASQGIPGVIDPRWHPGLPFRPAQFQDFHGEELLAQALLKVSSAESPRVFFLTGHGEPSLEGSEPTDLSRLAAALRRDGFEVEQWDPAKSPGVPAGCDVLALIGPRQPYQPATREAIEAWVQAGGRAILAPDLAELQQQRKGGVVELLGTAFGIVTRPGIVCQPLVQFGGEKIDGDQQCAWLLIDEHGMQAGDPLTEPLRMRGRRMQFLFSASFEGGYQSDSGLVLPLVTSAPDSWRDLEPYDFRFNPAKGEQRERQTLVTQMQLRAAKAEDGSVRQGRVLAVASAYFFGNDSFDVNRDFVLNAFNWMASREYRISVRPLEKSLSFLDFGRSSVKPVLTYSLWLGLPGLCALIGAAVFTRRRSG